MFAYLSWMLKNVINLRSLALSRLMCWDSLYISIWDQLGIRFACLQWKLVFSVSTWYQLIIFVANIYQYLIITRLIEIYQLHSRFRIISSCLILLRVYLVKLRTFQRYFIPLAYVCLISIFKPFKLFLNLIYLIFEVAFDLSFLLFILCLKWQYLNCQILDFVF